MEIMKSIIDALLDFVLKLLPLSPFDEIISSLEDMPFLGYLNWFIPIGTFIKIGAVWLTSITLFYMYSIILRWVKAIE